MILQMFFESFFCVASREERERVRYRAVEPQPFGVSQVRIQGACATPGAGRSSERWAGCELLLQFVSLKIYSKVHLHITEWNYMIYCYYYCYYCYV